MIVYYGGRLGMQQLVDEWIKEQRAAAVTSISFTGEVREIPSGEVLVSDDVDGRSRYQLCEPRAG